MAKVCVAFRSFRAEGFSFRNFNGGDTVFFVATFLLLLLVLVLNPLNDIKDIIFFFVLRPPSKSLPPASKFRADPGFCLRGCCNNTIVHR